VTRLATDPALTGIARALGFEAVTSPTTPVLHVQSDSLRVPDGYFGFAPHQDWSSIQGSLDSFVMWMPLVEVGVERFPVEFLPGSHLRGLLPGRIVTGALEVAPEHLEGEWTRIATRPGDAVMFSTFTVHRTAVEGCSGLRLALSTRFENSAEPTFVARGYPCAYRRTVERELITPGFPARDEVRRQFD
jgi:ectoine hydroxylase-related dioxygenase (phytanoyl-CoA dioxygenase family)